MIINCPECELQVSDKAIACPHCGYPMKKEVKIRPSTKRKRLPNGFGQISEIKNKNLRKPFRAMISVGKNSKGRPIVKPLKPECYFKTYNEAYIALVEYNKNPYDLDIDMTVKELYEEWSEKYFASLASSSSARTITSAWNYCSSVYDMRVKDIRARHIKGCMEDGKAVIKGVEKTPSPNTQSKIKSLFNLMLDYALEFEIVDRNYARTFGISKDLSEQIEKEKIDHISFKKEEIEKLWDHIDAVPYVNIVLFQCYTGFRPQELGLIRLENVHLDEEYIVGGMKTEAGSDRVVPIHPKIKHIVEALYEEALKYDSEYLINATDTTTHKSSLKMTYDKYRHRFEKIRDYLGLDPDHRAHDGRNHFITMAKRNNIDEYALKYIVGHKITDITEKTYTDRDKSWLIEEMKKIKE